MSCSTCLQVQPISLWHIQNPKPRFWVPDPSLFSTLSKVFASKTSEIQIMQFNFSNRIFCKRIQFLVTNKMKILLVSIQIQTKIKKRLISLNRSYLTKILRLLFHIYAVFTCKERIQCNVMYNGMHACKYVGWQVGRNE